jgi:hypothetical protein
MYLEMSRGLVLIKQEWSIVVYSGICRCVLCNLHSSLALMFMHVGEKNVLADVMTLPCVASLLSYHIDFEMKTGILVIFIGVFCHVQLLVRLLFKKMDKY